MKRLHPLVPMFFAACGGTSPPPPSATPTLAAPIAAAPLEAAPVSVPLEPTPSVAVLRAKLAQFVPATLTADVSKLPESERHALDAMIAAAQLIDPLFDRQVFHGYAALRERLAKDTSPRGQDLLAYFDLMRGPWDRQDHFAPFAIDLAHPKGAGFYPADLTADAFKSYVAAHSTNREALESLTTVVVREGDALKTVPYSEAYGEWLKPAAAKLAVAAEATQNKSLAKFLRSRALAFANDEYRQSDKDWMDVDSRVEITIGPYETYEDELLGLKAAFEACVTVSDPAESAKLGKYKKLLPDMEHNLPIAAGAHGKRGGDSPIHVVDVVYTSGDARKSVQSIAFNLPNDEVVRKEKGAKKVLLRNLIETKFERIMRPLAERILDPSQLGLLSAEAFFNETLFHELSHSLGPAFVKGTKNQEVRVALGSNFSAIEECKADVMGAYNILYMIKRGELPKELHDRLLVSYFAGLFRSVRFGVAEAHGQAAALQINRYLDEGAARFDPATKRFSVDVTKLEGAIGKLVHDLCVLQWDGDAAGTEALLTKSGIMSDTMRAALTDLDAIPVDVKPIYPLERGVEHAVETAGAPAAP
jgi:hypothetical protein